MSIAILSQVFTEARRLMIAGSVVARGDFRLKKLLPALEQAGKQAPVFAKVAEVTKAVIEGPEESAAETLLELTSLVSAVLYTQGETGLAGKLEPVQSMNLSGSVVQTSARVLKPLLEALNSTGSGRLELIREAVERGQFRDLRLVKPALNAIDDPYPEIAELICTKVLPIYGKAILPELRSQYDPKGTKGHPRRLKLMFQIDPSGTRELVKAALDGGSKEVKVAAISCLGSDPSDLNYLLEQSSAKAQDVRVAAYEALAKIDKPEAISVLQKGLTGKDFQQVGRAIEEGKNPKLIDALVAEIRSGIESVLKLKDKKQISTQASRIEDLIRFIPEGEFPSAATLLNDLFARRAELVKIKGELYSGSDILEAVIQTMASASNSTKRAIVAAHAEVPPDQLEYVFDAARHVLSSEEHYETFSPYLTAKVDEKKKSKDPAFAKREAIIDAVESSSPYYLWSDIDDDSDDDPRRPKPPDYDPRWLDLAVRLERLEVVQALAKPDHPKALNFVKSEFDAALKNAKSPDDVRDQLLTLARFKHPEFMEAFFATLAKRGKKVHYYFYWLTGLVTRLPKEAIPRLEALVAGMPENEANHWVDAIQELRTKA